MESTRERTEEQRREAIDTPVDLNGIVDLAAKVRDLRQEAPAAWELARGLEWAAAEIRRSDPLLSALRTVDLQILPEPIAKLVAAWRAGSKT